MTEAEVTELLEDMSDDDDVFGAIEFTKEVLSED